MAQVFDVPRYKDQVSNRVMFYARMHPDAKDFNWARFPGVESKTYDDYFLYQAMVDELDRNLTGVVRTDDPDEEEMFTRFCAQNLILRHSDDDMDFARAVGGVILKILAAHGNLPIFCDNPAMMRMLEGYLSMRYKPNMLSKDFSTLASAWNQSYDIMAAGLVSGNLGDNFRKKVVDKLVPVHQGSAEWQHMHAWYLAMCYLRTSTVTPENRAAHKDLKDGDRRVPVDMFSFDKTRAGQTLGCVATYRVVNLHFIVYHDAIYVLDHSMIDQLHLTSKRWEGNYSYCENYRPTGMFEKSRPNMKHALDLCRGWMIRQINSTHFSDALARSMKQSVALFQNEFHSQAEKLDVGWEAKSEKMESYIRGELILDVYWHEQLRTLDIPDRAKMDMSTLYYGIPAPDCDPRLLFKKASETMQNTNSVNATAHDGFIRYCKSYDLCKAILRHGAQVKYDHDYGYDVKEQAWYKRTLRGKMTLPPEEDLGKAWISDYFPFTDHVKTWYWEAADVTRVRADIDSYLDMKSARDIPQFEHSELLYALMEAPYLSGHMKPEEASND